METITIENINSAIKVVNYYNNIYSDNIIYNHSVDESSKDLRYFLNQFSLLLKDKKDQLEKEQSKPIQLPRQAQLTIERLKNKTELKPRLGIVGSIKTAIQVLEITTGIQLATEKYIINNTKHSLTNSDETFNEINSLLEQLDNICFFEPDKIVPYNIRHDTYQILDKDEFIVPKPQYVYTNSINLYRTLFFILTKMVLDKFANNIHLEEFQLKVQYPNKQDSYAELIIKTTDQDPISYPNIQFDNITAITFARHLIATTEEIRKQITKR